MYSVVMKKCTEGIKAQNRIGKTYHTFKVPQFLIHEPGYSIEKCIFHMITALGKEKYIVKFMAPSSLYIDWGSTSKREKNSQYIRDMLEKYPNAKVEFEYE